MVTTRRTQTHRPKHETRELIIDVLQSAPKPLSRTQIARAIERRKCPHLNNMIDLLVAEGLVQRTIKTFPTGVQGYVYAWRYA